MQSVFVHLAPFPLREELYMVHHAVPSYRDRSTTMFISVSLDFHFLKQIPALLVGSSTAPASNSNAKIILRGIASGGWISFLMRKHSPPVDECECLRAVSPLLALSSNHLVLTYFPQNHLFVHFYKICLSLVYQGTS